MRALCMAACMQAYCPLAQGTKLSDPQLVQLAARVGKTPAQVGTSCSTTSPWHVLLAQQHRMHGLCMPAKGIQERSSDFTTAAQVVSLAMTTGPPAVIAP